MRSRGAIVAISSHVARGSVGNRAMVLALERLGFTVWSVPTVILPHHPGHGPAGRIVPRAQDFVSLLETLVSQGRAGDVAAVISGYLAGAEQVPAVAALVQRVKAARPDAIYLCDPVIGDAGRLYVDSALADGIRDALLPLADAATPNAFECAWLAGQADATAPDLAGIAGALSPPTILVTSAPARTRGHVGNLLVSEGGRIELENPAVANAAKGTGDLLAALLLGRRLEGRDWPEAAELAIASVYEIVAGTARAGADELLLAELQQALVEPRASLVVRHPPQAGGGPPG